MNTFICTNCGKKLAELRIKEGIFTIRCHKCGTLNKVEIEKSEPQRRPVLKGK